jgi:hypothetical protein
VIFVPLLMMVVCGVMMFYMMPWAFQITRLIRSGNLEGAVCKR